MAGKRHRTPDRHVGREFAAVVASLQRDGLPAPSWGWLVTRWTWLASTVSRGYDDNLYEYVNDLGVRDTIQLVLDRLPAQARAASERAITEIDEQFTAATLPLEANIPGALSDAWWWQRVPTVGADELRRDIVELLVGDSPGPGRE